MRAIAIEKFGGPEVLKAMDLPSPQPGPEEFLVRIRASGVNPVDYKIREGLLQGRMPHQFPIILGWEAAGQIAAVGPRAKGFKEGDAVFAYCRKDIIQDGTYAESIALAPRHLAVKPKGLSWEEAAAVPLAGLTAYQALSEGIALKKGEVILIHAGAGGVGGYAIQLARHTGARVITTASPTHHPYVRELGAEEIIDYRTSDFAEVIRSHYPGGIDAVFDTVGTTTQIQSLKVLKKGGRLASILALEEPVQGQKEIRVAYIFVRPESSQLNHLKELCEAGVLKIHLAATFALEEAAKAHAMLETRHTAGKVALRI